MKELANAIYNTLKDLDFLDYEDTKEQDLQSLTNDLELLKNNSNGALLEVISLLLENN